MTKLEELEVELDKVWLDVGDGVIDLVETLNVIESAHEAYKEELNEKGTKVD